MKTFLDAVLFPGNHQERSPDPGPFPKYRSYKPYLQREFRRKCVYCRISDGLQGYESFAVDHYQPKSKFPHLVAAWENLFYACNVCNTWKGEFVSTPDQFLPNPCEHRMSDHLQYSGAGVETYTPHGEWFLKTRNDLIDDFTRYETRLDAAQGSEERGFASSCHPGDC